MKHKLYIALLTASIIITPSLSYAKPGQANENSDKNTNKTSVDATAETEDDKVRPNEDKKLLIDKKKEDAKQQMQVKKEETTQARFEKGKEKALSALDKRTNSLTEALNRLLNRKRIRQEEQAQIQSAINEVLSDINAAKEKVQNAADLESLKNEFKNAVYDTRVYAVIVPKVRAMAMTSALYNGVDRVEKVFPKVEEAIKNNPDKATEANKLLSEAKSLLALAESKTDQAWSEFSKMVPAQDTSAAKTHLEAGKKLLQEARDSVKQSVEKLKQIKAMIKTVEADEQEAVDEGQESEAKPLKTKTPAANTSNTVTPVQ